MLMAILQHDTFPEKRTRRWVYLSFWVLVTIVFLYDTRYLIDKASLPYFVINGIFRIGMLMTIGWINVSLLVPRFLLTRRYPAYTGLVFILIITYLLIQSLYDTYMYGFIMGVHQSNLARILLYNFSHTSLYLVLTLALKFSIDWYEQGKVLQEIRLQHLQAEVGYLRLQVNPHFLFNALNNLYALTLRKSDRAPEIVLKLSEMMEYMLYESAEPMVAMEKELRYIESFIELEQLRQEHKTDIRIEVSGAVERSLIPPFILLTLVENAFKHGLQRTPSGGFLHICISVSDKIDCTIENSKPLQAQLKKKKGIGLENLEKRLQLLYPGKHQLEINEDTSRFTVHLQIGKPW